MRVCWIVVVFGGFPLTPPAGSEPREAFTFLPHACSDECIERFLLSCVKTAFWTFFVKASRFMCSSCLLDFQKEDRDAVCNCKDTRSLLLSFYCFYFFSSVRKQAEPPLKDKDFSALVLGLLGIRKKICNFFLFCFLFQTAQEL